MKKLLQISVEAPFGKGKNMYVDYSVRKARHIDASKILSTTPTNLDLSSLVLNHFELPSELMMKVQAKLNKVVIYQNGCHYKQDCESIKFSNS